MPQLIGKSVGTTALRSPDAGGGESIFPVNAVNFDGTNDYLTRDAGFTGAVDGKVGIISVWLKLNDDTGLRVVFRNDATTGIGGLRIELDGDGIVNIQGQPAAGGNTIVMVSTVGIKAADDWVHLLASYDQVAAAGKLYLNDVDRTSLTTSNDLLIDYTAPDWGVGHQWSAGNPGASIYDGDMSDLYVNFAAFLDLTVTANRRLFISAGGKPVDLGSDGSTPTGTAPIVFLSGTTSTWHTNDGGGGGFTEVGALTDASTSPSD